MDDRSVVAAQREIFAQLAPGTPLREGLERILRGRTGALIVLGSNPVVDELCDGGFRLDVDFSPTRLRELCKMDGAVVLDGQATRILRANVQLMPDASFPTGESGTRHRTAERTSQQAAVPVIAVSHSMSTISLYSLGRRHEVADSAAILSRANQGMSTLHRYKSRLDEQAAALTALEIEDFTMLRDAVSVLQRLMMVRQIADELAGEVVELGTDGRLLGLQLGELVSGSDGLCELLIRDYAPDGADIADIVASLERLEENARSEGGQIARAMGYPNADALDNPITPRGHRLLYRIPRVPPIILERLIEHFSNLQGLLAASAADLQEVEGVGEARARWVREGLSRLAESALADRAPGIG